MLYIVGFSTSKVCEKPVKKSSKASKGTNSKPSMASISKAQTQPLPSPTIDVTKPISMILPEAQPERQFIFNF
jgi:hypothetical protein